MPTLRDDLRDPGHHGHAVPLVSERGARRARSDVWLSSCVTTRARHVEHRRDGRRGGSARSDRRRVRDRRDRHRRVPLRTRVAAAQGVRTSFGHAQRAAGERRGPATGAGLSQLPTLYDRRGPVPRSGLSDGGVSVATKYWSCQIWRLLQLAPHSRDARKCRGSGPSPWLVRSWSDGRPSIPMSTPIQQRSTPSGPGPGTVTRSPTGQASGGARRWHRPGDRVAVRATGEALVNTRNACRIHTGQPRRRRHNRGSSTPSHT